MLHFQCRLGLESSHITVSHLFILPYCLHMISTIFGTEYIEVISNTKVIDVPTSPT